MSTNSYHHGNLRNALIEAGIAYINEHGTGQFSLRKIAQQCGVSHMAPYSHFKDKEQLMEAMKEYVSERFALALDNAVQTAPDQDYSAAICRLGHAYVEFFSNNPQYYEFVFERAEFDINLDDIYAVNSYRPFEIFKITSVALFEQMHLPEPYRQQTLIKMWAMVHGMAGISVMQGIKFSADWAELTRQIIAGSFQKS